ncbi:unnamed protein product, partial [Discosporangium mesarthrocarpum]
MKTSGWCDSLRSHGVQGPATPPRAADLAGGGHAPGRQALAGPRGCPRGRHGGRHREERAGGGCCKGLLRFWWRGGCAVSGARHEGQKRWGGQGWGGQTPETFCDCG